MNKVKLTMGATLPTRIQYENVQPLVEVEADSFEEARDMALKQIQSIADIVRDNKPMVLNSSAALVKDSAKTFKRVTSVGGQVLLMDEVNHTYQDEAGTPYLSGSTFAHKFVREFPSEAISGKMAAKYEVEQSSILDMWAINAEASTSLGTSIHAALELYGKHRNTSRAVKEDSLEACTHKNPFLKQIVKAFYKDREDEVALYEQFVSDSEEHLCGFIDRLLVVDRDKKIVRVQDYKSNPDITKKKDVLPPFKDVVDSTELGAYWLQLSFYAHILNKRGWTVEGLDIFNIVAREQEDESLKIEVETHSHDVIDISNGL